MTNAGPAISGLTRGTAMARGALAFKQRDVTRAVRAVAAAGCGVARAEIDPAGKIVVVVGSPFNEGQARDASEVAHDRIAAMRGAA